MTSVTGALLINLLHLDPTFDDATMENLIDQAIDALNLYGTLDLPNMTGAAGSKTVELSSEEKGAVVLVTRAFYTAFYENPEGILNVGGLSISASDILSNPTLSKEIHMIARNLYKRLNEQEVGLA